MVQSAPSLLDPAADIDILESRSDYSRPSELVTGVLVRGGVDVYHLALLVERVWPVTFGEVGFVDFLRLLQVGGRDNLAVDGVVALSWLSVEDDLLLGAWDATCRTGRFDLLDAVDDGCRVDDLHGGHADSFPLEIAHPLSGKDGIRVVRELLVHDPLGIVHVALHFCWSCHCCEIVWLSDLVGERIIESGSLFLKDVAKGEAR